MSFVDDDQAKRLKPVGVGAKHQIQLLGRRDDDAVGILEKAHLKRILLEGAAGRGHPNLKWTEVLCELATYLRA